MTFHSTNIKVLRISFLGSDIITSDASLTEQNAVMQQFDKILGVHVDYLNIGCSRISLFHCFLWGWIAHAELFVKDLRDQLSLNRWNNAKTDQKTRKNISIATIIKDNIFSSQHANYRLELCARSTSTSTIILFAYIIHY